jgi:hypothetical protein
MLEHGADIKSQLRFGASKTDLPIAQLIQYNCYSKYTEWSVTQKHPSDREIPFPVYLWMSVYGKTRKKTLVEMLHDQQNRALQLPRRQDCRDVTANTIIMTKEEGALSNHETRLDGIAPCTHEADNRIFLHARHAVEEG